MKNDPPVDVSNYKQLQPFSVDGDIQIPHYVLPVVNNQIRKPRYKKGEVLVKFKKGVTLMDAQSKASALEMSVVNEFKVLSEQREQAYTLVKSGTLTAQEMIAQLNKDPSVEATSFNYEERISNMPNDPLFKYLWGLNNIGQNTRCGAGTPDADIDAPDAWDTNNGSSNVVVADIDTGVFYDHVDLASNMWHNPGEIPGNGIDDDGNGYIDDVYGIDAYNSDSDPMDDNGHGTHTSGIMAAAGNNNIGVTGVNWRAKIMALKFLSAGGYGYASDAITCIEYAISEKLNHDINVVAINASWGGGDYGQVMYDAIEEAGNAGILFCAAAGNWGMDNDVDPFYPASYDLPTIISVAASELNDNLAYFSNYGATSVDLAAPGDCILSTFFRCSSTTDVGIQDCPTKISSYAYLSGTSMATPHVTGAVALVAAHYSGDDVQTRKNRILSGVDPKPAFTEKMLTDGRLNLYNLLVQPTTTTTTMQPHTTSSTSSSITTTTTPTNSPPVANAGPDQTALVTDTVQLDGSGSSDVDGDALSYAWSFTSRPSGSAAALSDATAVNPTFTVDKFGTYILQLIVHDGTVASVLDTVTISTINSPPVASAGADQTAPVTDTVQLDGSGSSDVDGDALSYAWSFTSKPSGSAAALSDATAVNPTFTADKPGTYVLQLIVYDGTVASAPDTVTISKICIYSISSKVETFTAAGGTGFFNVTTQSGCEWTATISVGWIKSTSIGTGSGRVNYFVSPNTSTKLRTGYIFTEDQIFKVIQLGKK